MSETPFDPDAHYRMWWTQQLPRRDDLFRQRLASRAFFYRPTISILTPLFNTPPDILDRMLRSVANQTYPYWQHCLVDDGSTSSWLASYLERRSAAEPRLRVIRRPANGGIVAATNTALTMADGEFISLLDHDDELDPQALYAVAARLNDRPDTDALYSDFDVIDRGGRHQRGWFLTDWAPELLLMVPYVTHLSVYRRALVAEVGGWHSDFEGSQDYDLALRITGITQNVEHLPQVLYHWRQWERSVAGNPGAKPYAYEASTRAMHEHLRRNGIAGRREDGPAPGFHSVRFDVQGQPRVSAIVRVPAETTVSDATAVVDRMQRLLAAGDHDHVEIVMVARSDIATAITATSTAIPFRCITSDAIADTGHALNAGAAAASGDYLLFLDGGLGSGGAGWLHALLEYGQQTPIGAVGPWIERSNGDLWHTGVVLPQAVPYLIDHDAFLVNVSAVSGACLLTRREIFERAGGFRSMADAGHVDFDYCLRLRELGYRHVATRNARVRFAGALPAGVDAQHRDAFVRYWRPRFKFDPYYSRTYCQTAPTFQPSLST